MSVCRTRLLVLVSVVVTLLAFPPTASAYHEVGATGNLGCEGLNMADNGDHCIHVGKDVLDGMRAAVDWSRSNNLDPSPHIRTYDAPVENTYTDAVIHQDPLNGGSICGNSWSSLAGYTVCVNVNAARRCEKHLIQYNTDALNYNGGPQEAKREYACHEFGHSLGFHHRYSYGTCMKNDISSTYPWYDSHDRDMFYNYY